MQYITRHKVTVLAVLAIAGTSLSGCQWFKDGGSYFPVSEGVERCEDWFCFGDEPQKSTSARQRIPLNGSAGAPPPYQKTGSAVPPRGAQPQMIVQPQSNMPQQPNAFGKAMADQAAADNSGYPVGVRPPYSSTPVGGGGGAGPGVPGSAAPSRNVKAYDLPEGYGRRVPTEAQGYSSGQPPQAQPMHPYEENPEWKKDLPPSRFDALQKSLEW
jgi:hypothetical protein